MGVSLSYRLYFCTLARVSIHSLSNRPQSLLLRAPRREALVTLAAIAAIPSAARSTTTSAAPRRTLRVGLGHPYLRPSDAAASAQDGDEVLIDAGFYEDMQAIWRANRLLIRAVGGSVTIGASSGIAGLWHMAGQGITIRGVLFGGTSAPATKALGLLITGSELRLERCGFVGLGGAVRLGVALQGKLQLHECVIVRCGAADQSSLAAGDVEALDLHNCWIVANHAGPLVSSASGDVELQHCRLVQLSRDAHVPMIQTPFSELLSLRGCIASTAAREDTDGTMAPLIALGDPLMQGRRFQRVELLHNTIIQRSGSGRLLSSHQALKALIGQGNLLLGVDAFGENFGAQTRVWAENLQLPLEGLPPASLDWRDGRLPQRFSARALRKNSDTLQSAMDWRPKHDLPDANALPGEAALTLRDLSPSHRSLIGARQQFLPT